MNILHLSDSAFGDERWRKFYRLLEYLDDTFEVTMARTGWEKTKERFLSLVTSDPEYYRFVVFDGEKAVGWADFVVLSPDSPEQNVSIYFESAYDETPLGFERVVVTEFLRLFEERSATVANVMANNRRISDITRGWGATELNSLEQFRLVRSEADVELMESWLESIPKANPELRIEFFSPVPEEYLAEHTRLFVQYVQEMPTERESEEQFEMTVDEVRRHNEWRAKNDSHLYTYALFNDEGVMVAHSNAVITGADPSDVYQMMTGVSSELRGRGLSRWLKAALFFKIGEDFPDNKTMTTDMRSKNAQIHKVNEEMGYRLQHSGHEYEITVGNLRKFLG